MACVSAAGLGAGVGAGRARFGVPGMPPAYREPLRRRLQAVLALPGPAAQRQLTLDRAIGDAPVVRAAGALLRAADGAGTRAVPRQDTAGGIPLIDQHAQPRSHSQRV